MMLKVEHYYTLAIFIISLSLAIAGILISTILKKKYNSGIFSSLIFHQIFLYIFGFYGIWGQLILSAYFAPYIENDLYEKISGIALLTAYPFMVLAWMMLVALTREIVKIKTPIQHFLLFLGVNFIIILSLGLSMAYFPDKPIVSTIKYSFIIFNFIYCTAAALILVMHHKRNLLISKKSGLILSSGLFFCMLLQNISCLFIKEEIYLVLIFIIIYFLGSAFIPIYISYSADLSPLLIQSGRGITFNGFCEKYEVSKREMDIIREICNGHSNQQIAEKLFISIQTVKGHTHRIYFKINVRSRAQLISLVNSLDQKYSNKANLNSDHFQ